MNRQYEFVQTVPLTPISSKGKKTNDNYTDLCDQHLVELKAKLSNLNISESSSIKIVQASGKNFFGGFFVDKSGIRRPAEMPAGESWRYTTFWFENKQQMNDQLSILIDSLNNVDKLRAFVQVRLTDMQIYYSKIEFDLYGDSGAWTLWYKTE